MSERGVDKAKKLVQDMIDRGEKPTAVGLTLYTQASWDIHHPNESFQRHLADRQELVNWLALRDIRTDDRPVMAKRLPQEDLAEAAAGRLSLGIKLIDSLYLQNGTGGVVGWALIKEGMQPVKKGVL